MNERDALRLLAADLPHAGDDCAVVDGLVLTIDMLHASTDFPEGTTAYTVGWRSVGVSLSDVAAMGAEPIGAVAAYAPTALEEEPLTAFVEGARDVCERVGTDYVGGDLDTHRELTVTTTAVGRADDPVPRSGASPGEVVCVTGEWGRTAAALELFDAGDIERANDLFRFDPRIEAGRALAPEATAMMDSSDGLARSLHQLAEASGCGFRVDADALPVHSELEELFDDPEVLFERAVHVGEDFELVCTLPKSALAAAREDCPVPLTLVGRVTDPGEGVTVVGGPDDSTGRPLPDRGYTHE
ncbi:thiamine-monophosphate kinase [Halalkaliarchaeum desulfuricum]|uniref:Thiamine-monophosphate kinase n=1 Tax=Halalkaliarchaeum desulfuricum TaxID=2055893 RepID=A0A343TIV0_9EURY|nr:thiamine-phosphate kinase [Halalkaliarchaeum desulfuricum]AUX09022.1 thiamine-monophosphate kinase [Halalkaliarchaeum desulfuricum]